MSAKKPPPLPVTAVRAEQIWERQVPLAWALGVGAAAAFAGLLVGGFLGASLLGGGEEARTDLAVAVPARPAVDLQRPASTASTIVPPTSKSLRNLGPKGNGTLASENPIGGKVPETVIDPSSTATIPKPVKTVEPPAPVKTEHQPLDDLRDRKGSLRVPARGGDTRPAPSSGPLSGSILAKVYVSSPVDCELSLLGVEQAFGSASSGNITLERKDEMGIRSWEVLRKPSGALSAKVVALGTFKLHGQDLSFHWNPSVPPSVKPDALRYCMLKVEVGTESQVCRLSEPITVESIQFDSLDKLSSLKVDLPRIDAAMLPDVDRFVLQIKPVDFPGTVVQEPAEPIAPGQAQAFRVFGGTEREGAILEFAVSFIFDRERDKEDGREIRVKGVETYKTDSLSLNEATSIGRPLSVKELNLRLKEKKERLKNFERDAKRHATDFLKQKAMLEPEINRLTKFATIVKEKEAAKEAERKRDGLVEQLRRIKETADAAEQRASEAKDSESHVQETLALAQQLITKKSVLEFRIFIMVDQEEVELYRSKGFTREF